MHGQNDHLKLMRPAEQRSVLDRFAGEELGNALTEYRKVREEWVRVSAELTERTARSREMAREADLLKHGLAEIEAVAPQPGEDDELQARAKRLADADQLREAATGAAYAVSGAPEGDPDVPGALGLIADARHRLTGSDDPRLRELEPRLAEAEALLVDVGTELSGYLESLDADPAALEQVLARQAELKQLTRKYAADVDGVLAWAEKAAEQLAGLDTSEEALTALAKRRDELAVTLADCAKQVTVLRVEAADKLAQAVTVELGGLAMGQAAIELIISTRWAEPNEPHALRVAGGEGREALAHAGPDGVDEVEIRLRAHDGAVPLPVHKAASGGELSRVMLAIEVVLAHSDPVPTLVFDEVDAGVGGRAAVEIGRRLARLASSHQVIVVTHLPQVAAFADRHLVVDKQAAGGVTRSDVRRVDEQDRVIELARMLAGMDSTETGRAHAEELLAVAAADKKTHRKGRRRR